MAEFALGLGQNVPLSLGHKHNINAGNNVFELTFSEQDTDFFGSSSHLRIRVAMPSSL